MASLSQSQAALSPRQAARRRAPVDKLLDADLFKALADPTRLQLLRCLLKCKRPCSVSEVAECCDVDFSVVARHLGLLARAGVLEARKEGRTVWYAARCESLAATFRDLAESIQSLTPADACCGSDCCKGTN
ncbi:MAG: ArsR/SmtB family transcription factor [Phycisphaerales bacterium JB064]